MDDRITILRGSGDDSEVYTCGMCGNAILGSDPSFTVAGEGDDYCSMACARKALGIEEPVVDRCRSCAYAPIQNTIRCRICERDSACANYEPEAEPFKHTICSSLAVEAKPEAEVPELYWDTPQKRGKNIRQALRTLDNAVLVHDAYWPVDAKYAQLFLEAPQTARKLKEAEARIANLVANLNRVIDCDMSVCKERGQLRAEVARLQSELDGLHGVPFSSRCYHALKSRAEKAEAERAELRGALQQMVYAFDDYANTAGQSVVRKAKAALGKDGA